MSGLPGYVANRRAAPASARVDRFGIDRQLGFRQSVKGHLVGATPPDDAEIDRANHPLFEQFLAPWNIRDN